MSLTSTDPSPVQGTRIYGDPDDINDRPGRQLSRTPTITVTEYLWGDELLFAEQPFSFWNRETSAIAWIRLTMEYFGALTRCAFMNDPLKQAITLRRGRTFVPKSRSMSPSGSPFCRVGSMYYPNEAVMQTEGNPRAIFLCVDIYLPEEVIWKGGILMVRLTPPIREAIVRIESDVCRRSGYRTKASSMAVWDAVFDHGVRTWTK